MLKPAYGNPTSYTGSTKSIKDTLTKRAATYNAMQMLYSLITAFRRPPD